MTRWARANNVHKNKPAEATPWSQLRAGGGGRGGRGDGGQGGGHPGSSGGPFKQGGHPGSSGGSFKQGGQRDYLRGTQPGGSDIKKPNRKKKEYLDEDVNGFMEYLQQSGQRLTKGDRGGREDARELREEVETALKKDRRREDRRVKRQNDKKSNMVSDSEPRIPDSGVEHRQRPRYSLWHSCLQHSLFPSITSSHHLILSLFPSSHFLLVSFLPSSPTSLCVLALISSSHPLLVSFYHLCPCFLPWLISLSPSLLQLCFNCRKPGHGLADCPEADRDEEMGRGICYRCGSTEHEIQKCRAKVDPALGEDNTEAHSCFLINIWILL